MWDQQDQLHCVLAVFFRLFNYLRNLQQYKQRTKLISQNMISIYRRNTPAKIHRYKQIKDLDILLYQNKGS